LRQAAFVGHARRMRSWRHQSGKLNTSKRIEFKAIGEEESIPWRVSELEISRSPVSMSTGEFL
jgi:hypothetical protein